MRSGLLGNVDSERNVDFLRKVVSIVKLIGEEAVSTSVAFARACGRTMVTKEDMLLAMRYEAHEFFDTQNLEERFVETLAEEKTHTYTTDDEDNDDDTSLESDECESCDSEEADENYTTEFVDGDEAAAKLHAKIMKYNSTWDEWQPTDPVLLYLKSAIDSIPHE